MKYGKEPMCVGELNLAPSELMFIQYLPLAFPGSEYRIPQNLRFIQPILDCVAQDEYDSIDFNDYYVYATVRNMYVTSDNMGNRPGWHSDGFGTDDINYIWCDSNPTEFCIQDFDLSQDCNTSLQEMEAQADEENITTYGVNTLLKLDQFAIHRVPMVIVEPGFRRFVKISVSKDKYNLQGNSHNYFFNYDWEMQPRKITRNHPTHLDLTISK